MYMYVYLYSCMYIYIYVYIYGFVCIHVYTHTSTYIYIYVYTHTNQVDYDVTVSQRFSDGIFISRTERHETQLEDGRFQLINIITCFQNSCTYIYIYIYVYEFSHISIKKYTKSTYRDSYRYKYNLHPSHLKA
jgi:hypothetical protein